jgi:hypothetical protein
MGLRLKALRWKNFRKYSFLKLWLVHTVVLYSFLGFSMSVVDAIFPHNPRLGLDLGGILATTLLGPLGGVTGWLDGFPAFVLLPLALMGMIRLYWFKSSWFTSYILALLICYTVKGILDRRWYLIGIALGNRQLKDLFPSLSADQLLGINLLGTYLILLIPIGVVWWLFRGSKNKPYSTQQELNIESR